MDQSAGAIQIKEMRMLRLVVGLTRLEQVRNEYVRVTVEVLEIAQKLEGNRFEVVRTRRQREVDEKSCERGQYRRTQRDQKQPRT